MLVSVGLLYPLVLGASVLEPDLDLSLRELEPLRELAAPGAGDVLGGGVLHLQHRGLLLAERGPLPPRPRVLPSSPRHWKCLVISFSRFQIYKLTESGEPAGKWDIVHVDDADLVRGQGEGGEVGGGDGQMGWGEP